jgi:hypothetical protein
MLDDKYAFYAKKKKCMNGTVPSFCLRDIVPTVNGFPITPETQAREDFKFRFSFGIGLPI